MFSRQCNLFQKRQSSSSCLLDRCVTFFVSSVTDRYFVDETRVWRKYKFSILVSMMSLFAFNHQGGENTKIINTSVYVYVNKIDFFYEEQLGFFPDCI